MEGPNLVKQVVLVSGAPGAGKSTLAVPLATELRFALLSKDVIKERLHDSLGLVCDDPLVASRKLGAAAMDLLWTLAGQVPRVVLEANFRPASEHEVRRLSELGARIVEVYCSLPAEEAVRRYALRAGDRHPTHVLRELDLADTRRQFGGPVGLGEVIEVRTDAPVDVRWLADRVREGLSSGAEPQ